MHANMIQQHDSSEKRKQFSSLNFCYCLRVQQKWKGEKIFLKYQATIRKEMDVEATEVRSHHNQKSGTCMASSLLT